MLTTLRIKNLALVADLTLEFQPGYNVITGETGAGKSILIGALSLVLGDRADRTLIRSGSDSCLVEAVFDVARLGAPLGEFLAEKGLEPCEAGQLVLKRSFSTAGANRQFVNGSPTTLALLIALGQWLVDIHGPHDHQSLLQPAKQLAILDAFGKLDPARHAFAARLRQRQTLETAKAALVVDEQTYAQQLDLLRFQTGEIEAGRLRADEEAQLESDYHRASNSAKLLQLGQSALALLGEDDAALITQARALGRALQDLGRIDAAALSLASFHEQAMAGWRDLREQLSRYLDKIDIDPARLQELEDRLNFLHSLKRKYGASLTDVMAFGQNARKKLAQLEQRDAELQRLNLELKQAAAELARAGRELSRQRRKIIPQLCQAVTHQLSQLGFGPSRFAIDLASSEPAGTAGDGLTAAGLDTIEFQFAPNVGEPARPLRAIASSGEMARVMLALKSVLAAEDEIPVLVFDEVDANIGGETAVVVGERMRQIARQRQVLCITHLAPVAACAATHFLVDKQVRADRTLSEIRRLLPNERVTELARMLGGQSEAARKHARSLLEAGQ